MFLMTVFQLINVEIMIENLTVKTVSEKSQ